MRATYYVSEARQDVSLFMKKCDSSLGERSESLSLAVKVAVGGHAGTLRFSSLKRAPVALTFTLSSGASSHRSEVRGCGTE